MGRTIVEHALLLGGMWQSRDMKPTLVRARRFDARSGQVIVVAAVAMIAMMIMAALVVDVGYIRFSRAHLQNTADAAAMAGALELVDQRIGETSEASARAAAEQEAKTIADQNCGDARCQVLFGEYRDGQFAELDVAAAATAVEVRMHRDETAPEGPLALFFAPVAGVDTAEVHRTAVSQIARGLESIQRSDLMPFGVHESQVLPVGATMTVYDAAQPAPGNFGLLDFDGGLNATGDLVDWILNGYSGEVTTGSWIEGTPGWRPALTSAVEERLGDTVLICIYSDIVPPGANTVYEIIGFLAVKFTAILLTGNDKYIRADVVPMQDVPYSETGGEFDDNLVKIQLVM